MLERVQAEHTHIFLPHLLGDPISESSAETLDSAGEGGRLGPSLDAVDTGATHRLSPKTSSMAYI